MMISGVLQLSSGGLIEVISWKRLELRIDVLQELLPLIRGGTSEPMKDRSESMNKCRKT